jgi:hypothetical protein
MRQGGTVSDDDLLEFMELMREYRNVGSLPPEKHNRFKVLVTMYEEFELASQSQHAE